MMVIIIIATRAGAEIHLVTFSKVWGNNTDFVLGSGDFSKGGEGRNKKGRAMFFRDTSETY